MFNRLAITDALRFWERARIPYNIVLVAWTLWLLREIVAELPFAGWMMLALAAVFANVAYTIVYPVDLAVQASEFNAVWRRYGRPMLWLTGLFTAAMLATIALSPLV
jgi:hypothetical protein